MSLILIAGKLADERVYNDELLATLQKAIDHDIAMLGDRRGALLDQANAIVAMQGDLQKRKEELATEFATRRAALSALIGEEGGNE